MLYLNNPGNIRNSNDHFVGERKPSVDMRFKQFETMAYGYRAMFIILRTYAKQGVNTIAKIIKRYAPTNENDTAAYIDYVSKMRMHKNPDDVLNLNDKETVVQLVYAMSYFENGSSPNMAEIEQGWNLFSAQNQNEPSDNNLLRMIFLGLTAYFLLKRKRKWK
jgi:hypothetical protein